PEPTIASAPAPSSNEPKGSASITRLRLGEVPGRTRVVLDMDGDSADRVERIFNPDGSVSVTLSDTRLGGGFAVPGREIALIRQMVIDQQEDTVYIHIVPTEPANFTYQTLPQNDAGHFRFLIDVKTDTSLAASEDT
ncbi:MAG: hypothetical protein AAF420_03545, partial [Pseudomonadota bacterium]